mmetsp:Transcript_68218/g.120405  ORF Transcript_68218/g.120405 Transcript_68218/m.120405 type:complete len:256 (-) Transcript_68218:29-796(-)
MGKKAGRMTGSGDVCLSCMRGWLQGESCGSRRFGLLVLIFLIRLRLLLVCLLALLFLLSLRDLLFLLGLLALLLVLSLALDQGYSCCCWAGRSSCGLWCGHKWHWELSPCRRGSHNWPRGSSRCVFISIVVDVDDDSSRVLSGSLFLRICDGICHSCTCGQRFLQRLSSLDSLASSICSRLGSIWSQAFLNGRLSCFACCQGCHWLYAFFKLLQHHLLVELGSCRGGTAIKSILIGCISLGYQQSCILSLAFLNC